MVIENVFRELIYQNGTINKIKKCLNINILQLTKIFKIYLFVKNEL